MVGASVRAAAMSILRWGATPYCIDQFADRDLQAIADCRRIERFPEDIGPALRSAPTGPWMYTGGLENHPDLLEEWSAERECLGSSAAAVRRVRDPEWLARHLPYAAIDPAASPGGRWLVKPRQGAGGHGIAFHAGGPVAPTHYLQNWVDGRPISGQFRDAEFIGATEQLIGLNSLNAGPFTYCGSIGPIPVDAAARAFWEDVGRTLAAAGLRHCYSVDAIESDRRIIIIEANPRYSAGWEVVELGNATGQVVGKAIYFAPRDLVWESELAIDWSPGKVPEHADVPHPGTRANRGEPVLSLMASSTDVVACRAALDQRIASLKNFGLP